ncbi:MAG: hypothetical protein KDI71_19670 [Xanthomonadales bacterium]|nr:hypothetical protein [Xanthomonadales bacterium]
MNWRWMTALCCVAAAYAGEDRVFDNGFELALPACVQGELGGATLPQPDLAAAELLGCVEIRNDSAARVAELAVGSIPIPAPTNLRDEQLSRLVLIGPGGRIWPASFSVISRWGRPLTDNQAAIRWLGAQLSVDSAEYSSASLALLRMPKAPALTDPGALQVSGAGDLRTIDTGAAEFVFDASRSQPIRQIRLREGTGSPLRTVFDAVNGSKDEGWQITLRQPDGTPIIEASEANPGSLQIDQARWQGGTGGVAITLHLDGHLQTDGLSDHCPGNPEWRRFPFSLSITASRGSADLTFEWQLGNACGSPQSAPDDSLVTLEHASFTLPLARAVESQSQGLALLDDSVLTLAQGTPDLVSLAQSRGGGTPWQRQAELRVAGALSDSRIFYASPALSLHRPLGQSRMLAMVVAPWLRYREPQGLTLESGRLGFALVHSPIPLAKAKSLWFSGRLALLPVTDAATALASAPDLRARSLAALERGLTLRALPETLDAAQILPPLNAEIDHPHGNAYRQYLTRKHGDTVGDEPCVDAPNDVGSQWTCALTYGLALWPDVQFDAQFGFAQFASPADNEGKLNYWDPAHIELMEFLRGGDPRWLWDFANPQSRLMAYSAYYNFGPQRGSNIAGHSFGSGGSGDGLWHRGANGSADYSYNRHQALAYLLRPSLAQRDRFAAAGDAARLRFSDDPGDPTTWSAIGRLNLQYLESLANCAQFVPGAAGSQCDLRLRQVLGKLIDTSLPGGLMCEGKFAPGPDCFVGQLFMLQAWFYPVLERLYLNYGQTFPPLRQQRWRSALSQTPARMLAALPRSGGQIDVNANWPGGLQCQLGGIDFNEVNSCVPADDLENLLQNKPAFLSLLVRAHDYDNSLGLCDAARSLSAALFSGNDPLGFLRSVARGGWWKGAAESGQELVTASVGLTRCAP